MWWVAIAAAAELQGFQRIWVNPEGLALSPVTPATPAEISGIALLLREGEAAAPIVAAATAAGFHTRADERTILIEGAEADRWTFEGRPLVELGTVRLLPALRSRLPGPPHALVVSNPLARRVEVTVNGVAIGRVIPRATAAIVGIPAGSYAVVLTGPDGERREAVLETTEGHPALTAPPAATLPSGVVP